MTDMLENSMSGEMKITEVQCRRLSKKGFTGDPKYYVKSKCRNREILGVSR